MRNKSAWIKEEDIVQLSNFLQSNHNKHSSFRMLPSLNFWTDSWTSCSYVKMLITMWQCPHLKLQFWDYAHRWIPQPNFPNKHNDFWKILWFLAKTGVHFCNFQKQHLVWPKVSLKVLWEFLQNLSISVVFALALGTKNNKIHSDRPFKTTFLGF